MKTKTKSNQLEKDVQRCSESDNTAVVPSSELCYQDITDTIVGVSFAISKFLFLFSTTAIYSEPIKE